MAKIKPKALLAQSKQKKGPTQIGLVRIITYIVLDWRPSSVVCILCLSVLAEQRTGRCSSSRRRRGEL
uniref:Uncharacterized protein n=1 Tax=Aegilops tauschii subsp. strangulata TaxID=200361 RepID=A0A453MBX3_AEGTS